MKTILSYSTLNSIRQCNKYWLCKKDKLPTIDFPWFKEGKDTHRVIQDHVSGQKEDERLIEAGITKDRFHYPLVEKKDFDDDMRAEIDLDDKYKFIMFFDGLNPDEKRFLEIKTSGKIWSLNDWIKSMQRKIGALMKPDYLVADLISCKRTGLENIKKYSMPLTDKDSEEAREWIEEGKKIIEKGTFDKGEDINCERCVFQNSCPYR